jgi:leukotriene-A4 hydrolase
MQLNPRFFRTYLLLIFIIFIGCTNKTQLESVESDRIVKDVHSFSNPNEVIVQHLDINLHVNFAEKKLFGKTGLHVKNKSNATNLILDIRDMNIQKVTLGDAEKPTTFKLGERDSIHGQPLIIEITPTTELVTVYYTTSPDAAALQWLQPNQTTGGKHPFLFTQSQAILARTWIPCQDTPGVRATYTAHVKTDPGLMAVMSAKNPLKKSPQGIYEFEMPQPISSYLLALAVGDIAYMSMGPHSGVYADPTIVEAAAYEFGNTEDMIGTAEKLYGAYRWGKYNILVLPPTFPFGGMENPRLTFATPTVLAGDRSLTSLIAHELAHSWSGNLVTNATWDDFWLNEGVTTYIERRIMEELYGRAYEEMLAALGFQDLREEVERLGENDPDTRLHLDLEGRDPDDGMTDVAYEKGALFLRMLEESVGREKWDSFLHKYFDAFAFQTMTSEKFVDYLMANLFRGDVQKKQALRIDEWIYGTGIPDNCPQIKSKEFEKVENQINSWEEGTKARMLDTKDWTTHHWLHFLRNLLGSLSQKQMAELDVAFDFTQSTNSEILFAWLKLAIRHKYQRAYPVLENFLMTIGRRKFLEPLYKELAKTLEGKEMALRIYQQSRGKYHAITYQTIDKILNWKH